MKYTMTIGIECHVQLNTKTKLFSSVDNDAVDKEPNACVSPGNYAIPGTLPVLNKAAVEKAVRAGLAMNAEIRLESTFDRKHYFYPDLPSGYQITQKADQSIIGPGAIHLPDGSTVRIEHAHLEEDAGKLTHFSNYSLVDLNRAGTPLIEIVSMPDIHSAAQARLYCEELRNLMIYAGVTDGNLYHGNMRFDVNISVAPEGAAKLGTRVEIKNINSFRSIERAAQYEFQRQVELVENGETFPQETRGWNDVTGKTSSQRNKEQALDYRYMPEPDVPHIKLYKVRSRDDESCLHEFVRGDDTLSLKDKVLVDEIAQQMPPMPSDYREKFAKIHLDPAEGEAILTHQILAERLTAVIDQNPALAPRIAHWFSGLLLAEENLDKDFSLATPAELTELSEMVEKNELSSTASKEVFLQLYSQKNTTKTPHALAKEMNLLQENDTETLSSLIDEILALPECAAAVTDIKSGETKAIGFLVGQVMKKSAGKANPATVNELIKQKLN